MFKSLWVRQTTKRFRAEAVLSGEKVTYINSDLPRWQGALSCVDYVPDISEAGEVLGFVICQDLTEHKRTEEVLRQQSGSDWWRRCKRASPTLSAKSRTYSAVATGAQL